MSSPPRLLSLSLSDDSVAIHHLCCSFSPFLPWQGLCCTRKLRRKRERKTTADQGLKGAYPPAHRSRACVGLGRFEHRPNAAKMAANHTVHNMRSKLVIVAPAFQPATPPCLYCFQNKKTDDYERKRTSSMIQSAKEHHR